MEKVGHKRGMEIVVKELHALPRGTTPTPQLHDVLINPKTFEIFMEVL